MPRWVPLARVGAAGAACGASSASVSGAVAALLFFFLRVLLAGLLEDLGVVRSRCVVGGGYLPPACPWGGRVRFRLLESSARSDEARKRDH